MTIALLAAAAAPVAGQCTLQSQAGYGFPGVAGHVTALVPWDPDGVGPLPWHVVLGGAFVHAGTVDATHLAAWNPANGAWLALPAAPGGAVTALAAQPTGELVVALEVWQSGPTPVARIVAWNGVAWTVLGPDFDAPVRALHVRPNGQLVAAGSFTPAGGGASLGGVVAWNGAVWSSVGGGIPGEVATLATMPNGDLLAGGTFPSAGGVAATNVARWNGTAWSALGGGTTSPVTALVPAGSSRVFAGTMSDLVEWNGTSWAVVPGLNAGWTLMPSISALTLLQGQLVATGYITVAGGVAANGIAALDLGTGAWSTFGAGIQPWNAGNALLELPGGGLLVAGSFHRAGLLDVGAAARWDGTAWRALSDGPRDLRCVVPFDDTTFAIGGSFTNLGNVLAANVARWDGAAWQPLGPGLDGHVWDLEVLPNGELIAAGYFQASGATTARGLARWNGSAWSEFGGVTAGAGQGHVARLESMPDGDVVAAGGFDNVGGVPANNVAHWRSGGWLPLGGGLPSAVTNLVRVGANGLVAACADRSLWSWDGATWAPRGSVQPNDTIDEIASLAGGSVVVTGRTTLLGGSNYQGFVDVFPPGWLSGMRTRLPTRQWVVGLVSLPDGSALLTSGLAGAGGAPSGAARMLPAGTIVPATAGYGITCARFFPNGDLLAGGFLDTGTAHSLGRLRSTCAAAAAPGGAGCTGSGGPNLLAATALPWIGSTFAARATGMPTGGLAVGVYGLTAGSLPLAAVLPQASPGCSLLVAPDLLDAYVPAGGVVRTQLSIPNAIALVGVVLHEQIIALEIGGGALVAATSTNRLTLTAGAF